MEEQKVVDIIYAPEISVEEYYKKEGFVNQSLLKGVYLKGADFFSDIEKEKELDLFYRENTNFIVGDYLDGYLTKGPKYLKEKFFVDAIGNKPSESIMSIVQEYYADTKETVIQPSIVYFARKVGYRNNYSDEKLAETIKKEGQEYLNFIIQAKGKQIVSSQEMELIEMMIVKLEDTPHLKTIRETPWKIFNHAVPEQTKFTYDVVFQMPLYFKFNGVDCKGLPDIVIVCKDEKGENKEAHIVDLKTSGTPVGRLKEAIDNFRYDLQLAFYREGLAQVLDISPTTISCSLLLVSKVNRLVPALWVDFSEDLLKRGKYGIFDSKSVGKSRLNLITDLRVKGYYGIPYFGFMHAIESFVISKTELFSEEMHYGSTVWTAGVEGLTNNVII